VKNGKFYIKSTKRGHKMIEIGNFDEKKVMKEEYLAGRLSQDDYSKWLKAVENRPKAIIPAKNSQINPNLAFRKRKGKENPFRTYGEMLEARKKIEDEKKKMVLPGGKYVWMDHAQEPDDDVPF
jgi:hypothetical protein